MYEYAALIVRVVDGDTVHADVDLGLDVHIGITFRLAGINAPEISTHEGVNAKRYLTDLIEGKSITVQTLKDKREKYGRYLGVLISGGIVVNDLLVSLGLAVPYDGGKR